MKELTMEITNRCSLRCIQCSTKATDKGHVFMSLDQAKRHLDRFRDYDEVRLSGGEPFEHPRIDRICELIKGCGKKARIMTCGTYYREPIPYTFLLMLKPNVDEIIFSYHGFSKTHEKIVTGKDYRGSGDPPNWGLALDSVDRTRLAKIPFSFQTVLMKENFSELEKIAQNVCAFGIAKLFNSPWLGEEELNWHILRFVKQGRGKDNSYQAIDEEQARELPRIVKQLGKRFYNVHITLSGMRPNLIY